MSVNQVLKKIIGQFNFSITKKVNNTRFKIPLLNAVGALNLRSNEKWMEQLLTRLFEKYPNSVFVDVGVNIGQTLLKLKSVNAGILYYGFEPNPVCNYYVKELVRLNNLKNCHLYPIGLGSEVEVKELFFFNENDISSASGSTVADLFGKNPVSSENIALFTLDYFKDRLFQSKQVDVLKVDVENGELEVLQGAVQTIEQFKPLIITEVLPVVSEKTAEKTNRRKLEMQKLMENLDYRFFKVVIDKQDNLVGLRSINNLAVESAQLSQLHYDFNYMIVPKQKHNSIIDLIIT